VGLLPQWRISPSRPRVVIACSSLDLSGDVDD